MNRVDGGRLSVTSWVTGEQVRTVSNRRLDTRLGAVSEATLAKVADVVRVLLGLQPSLLRATTTGR